MSSIVIAGCGYVGTKLAEQLASTGHEVVAVRRSAMEARPAIRSVQADVCDPTSLFRALPTAADAIVYGVGAEDGSEAAYARAYEEGVRSMLAWRAGCAKDARFVFLSSTAVYGHGELETVDETTPLPMHSTKERHLVAGEDATRAEGGIVLRLSGIYGEGRERLVRMVASGEARLPRGPRPTNRIHRDDCAGAVRHLLFHALRHDTYLGTDADPADLAEVLAFLAARLGVATPPLEEDSGTEFGLSGFSSRESGQSELRPRFRGNRRCDGSRLRESGYVFTYPTFREGYAPLVDAWLARSDR